MRSMFWWRHQYDLDRDEGEGDLCVLISDVPSLTQQQFAQDADLNVLAKRFGVKDGSVLPAAVVDPRYYGDVSEIPDLRTALDRVRDASDRFAALPAQLRARFHNRPDLLHEFVSKPENAEEAVRLGLLVKRQEASKPPAAVPPPPPPAAA